MQLFSSSGASESQPSESRIEKKVAVFLINKTWIVDFYTHQSYLKLLKPLVHQKASTTSSLAIIQLHASVIIIMVPGEILCTCPSALRRVSQF